MRYTIDKLVNVCSILVMCLAVATCGNNSDNNIDDPRLAAGICIPDATGVPGQPGPPAWWGGGTGATDDPRWLGALATGHTSNAARMRALRYVDGTQKYLVLSWNINSDTGPSTAGNDFMYVGFWDPATASGNIIRVTRTASTSVTDGTFGNAGFVAEMFYRDNSTAGAWQLLATIPAAPAWLQTDSLLDATCAVGPPPTCSRWAIRMRVPVGSTSPVSNPVAGLPIPGVFRMWYELHVEMAGPSIARYKWPATADTVTDFPTFTFPDPTLADQWNTMDSLAAMGACSGGVRLASGQIDLNGGGNVISTTGANIFHVRPTNNTANPIAGDQLRARLRISDWGPVLYDAPVWADINPSSPSCASATGSAVAIAPGTDFDLTCSWTLTPEQQCQYRPDLYACLPMPPALNSNQCILAELYSTTDVLLARHSACRDVLFQ